MFDGWPNRPQQRQTVIGIYLKKYYYPFFFVVENNLNHVVKNHASACNTSQFSSARVKIHFVATKGILIYRQCRKGVEKMCWASGSVCD